MYAERRCQGHTEGVNKGRNTRNILLDSSLAEFLIPVKEKKTIGTGDKSYMRVMLSSKYAYAYAFFSLETFNVHSISFRDNHF